MKKFFNEGNQIHNFITSSGYSSDFLTIYFSGSGSARQKDKFGSYGSGYDFLKVTIPVLIPL
jgi:hypothetical protein